MKISLSHQSSVYLYAYLYIYWKYSTNITIQFCFKIYTSLLVYCYKHVQMYFVFSSLSSFFFKFLYFLYTDINECTTGSALCNQGCTNTVGSYTCYCSTGYSLDTDQFTCTGSVISFSFVCFAGFYGTPTQWRPYGAEHTFERVNHIENNTRMKHRLSDVNDSCVSIST